PLLTALVQADLRPLGVVGPGVDVQHVLQRRHEAGVGLGRQHPVLLQPRLDLVFFSARQTVAGSMLSTTSISTSLSANSFIVQRACPSGGGLQASAASRASWAPSSLRYSRPLGRFRCTAASGPCCTNFLRTRATVAALVSRASAMRSSASPGP